VSKKGVLGDPAAEARIEHPRSEAVREGRVELPRPFGHRILSPARLPFRHSRVVEAFTSVNGGWGLEAGQIRLQPGDAWEHGSLSAFPVVRHHVPAEAAAPRFFTRQPLSVGRFDSETGEEVIEPQHEEDVLDDERSNNDLASHASSVMLAMLRARGGTVTLPCIRCSHGLCIDGPLRGSSGYAAVIPVGVSRWMRSGAFDRCTGVRVARAPADHARS
jgi:hypothetical protein